jgi:hypothetical protein
MPAAVASAGQIVLAAAVPGSSYAFAEIDRGTAYLAVSRPAYLYSCPVSPVA